MRSAELGNGSSPVRATVMAPIATAAIVRTWNASSDHQIGRTRPVIVRVAPSRTTRATSAEVR